MLSGVPLRTVYEWAADEIVIPSVSDERVMLWSWTDLLALRAVYWLRHPRDTAKRKPASLDRVRSLIAQLRRHSESLGKAVATGNLVLAAEANGEPLIVEPDAVYELRGESAQAVAPDLRVNLIDAFSTEDSVVGPNLRRPGAHLLIAPGKLAGEPHIEGTRIRTAVLWSLSEQGFSAPQIVEMYPGLTGPELRQALRFERRLHTRRAA